MDLTTCPHTIYLCQEPTSNCKNPQKCKIGAHIDFSCTLVEKFPVLDLLWPVNYNFQALPAGEEYIILAEEHAKKLTTDFYICYKYVNAIKEGIANPRAG